MLTPFIARPIFTITLSFHREEAGPDFSFPLEDMRAYLRFRLADVRKTIQAFGSIIFAFSITSAPAPVPVPVCLECRVSFGVSLSDILNCWRDLPLFSLMWATTTLFRAGGVQWVKTWGDWRNRNT